MPKAPKPKCRDSLSTGPSSGPNSWTSATSGLHSYRAQLVESGDRLNDRISAIDGALSALGAAAPSMTPSRGSSATARTGVAGPRGRGRFRPRAGSLKEHIENVLGNGATMPVKEITDAVLKSGYKTKNKTLANSVGTALAGMKNVQKAGRGQYRLR